MSISQFARIFQRNVSRKSSQRRRLTLAFESLEDRAVPANNLTIVDGVDDLNIQVHNPGNSPTVTIRTYDLNTNVLVLVTADLELK